MVKDDEIAGITGGHNTADYWEYDNRLGRRWNIDPMIKPWESSYAGFSNNPILFSDPQGLDGGGFWKKVGSFFKGIFQKTKERIGFKSGKGTPENPIKLREVEIKPGGDIMNRTGGGIWRKAGVWFSKVGKSIVNFFRKIDLPDRGGYDLVTNKPTTGTGLVQKPKSNNIEIPYTNIDGLNISSMKTPNTIVNKIWTAKEGFEAVNTIENITFKVLETTQAISDEQKKNKSNSTILSNGNSQTVNENVNNMVRQGMDNLITPDEMEKSGIILDQFNPSEGSSFKDTKTGEIISSEEALKRINQRLYK